MSEGIITKYDGTQVNIKNEVDFDFKGLKLPALVDENNDFWFSTKDVAEHLYYTRSRDMIKHVEDDEKGATSLRTLGGIQQGTVISESGFYRVALRASVTKNKPHIRDFQRWVLHEVLPSIRKYGIAILEERLNELEPKDLVKLLSDMNPDAEVREENDVLFICAKDIKNNVGYKSTNAITYRLREGIHFKKFNRIIYINNSGLQIVIERSRKPEATEIAKLANLNVVKEVPEASVIGEIIKTFGRKYKIDDQKQFIFEGNKCRADLFFPQLDLAIEIDEDGHKDRDPEYEQKRQAYMEHELGWKVIRVNPHEQTFTTADACGLIFDFIFDYLSK